MDGGSMGRKGRFIVAILLLTALCGCAFALLPGNVKLGRADAGRTVDLATGGALEITLDGNPTTGYAWIQLSGNNAVLKPVGGDAYKQNQAAAGVVGVGGQFTFQFKAVGAGATQLKFGYRRPWEKNVPPIETLELNIRVK